MTNNPAAGPSLQTLDGTLERITFQSEDTGYTVARLSAKGHPQEITVVGPMSGINVGESVHLLGRWTNHPQYGRQFEVTTFSVAYPATITGIQKYLGSGLVKGVGPVTAERIVGHFGLETLDVIESSPHRLREVAGIGDRKAGMISAAWEEQKQIKEIMIFLQGHGVSTGLAVKIFKQYGPQSISTVKNSPYRLAKDIYGIGFKTADKIARQMGVPVDSPDRLRAGLVYTLGKLSDEGHCFAYRTQLTATAAKLLEVSAKNCDDQVDQQIREGELIAEDEAVYLPPFMYAEQGTASRLRRIQASERDRLAVFRRMDWQAAFALLDRQGSIQMTEQQKSALKMALTEKVSVLTGGPGTGKSTITAGIIRLLQMRSASVLLCAPTGRAAKRLTEATGIEAKTIHRLLEFKPTEKSQFARDQANPLNADLIIVDEASMIDLLLMNHLLDAIEVGSHLLLVGDVDQLPSVGPGNVLRDIIASQVFPVTRLETIFRQSDDSFIIVNAHRINAGEVPMFEKNSRDFFLFAEKDADKASDWVVDLVSQRIPTKFGFSSADEIQVLCPMHRGSVGVSELNQRLQIALNPPAPGKSEIRHGHRVFRVGDRVMQIINNYDHQVFNGDLGRLTRLDIEESVAQVEFDDRTIDYEFAEMDQLVHAYAISIHKSQGSEFPVVVIPILNQHYLMLQRNLLYTAVTRARKLVVLVGSRQAIGIAVNNNRISQRNTRLCERLINYVAPPATQGLYAV